jgi:predicted O-methyltransferase YrrM
MKFSTAAGLLDGVPYISLEAAQVLYEFILKGGVRDVLELGFAHGSSTCFMAAALDERGSGRITTMDKVEARNREPSLVDLIGRMELRDLVEPIYSEVTYTWELMRMIERNTVDGVCRPAFDFCYIDGAHTWETDGLAFFLVDKLLRPGGWVLFDDLHWSYASDPDLLDKPWIRPLPEDMKATAQVGKVFGLLVAQHPGYGQIRVEGEWGWARKIGDSATTRTPPDLLNKVYGRPGIARDAALLVRRLTSRLRRGDPGR